MLHTLVDPQQVTRVMGLEASDTVPLITDEWNGGHEVSSIEIQKDLSEYIGGEVIDDRVMITVDQRWYLDHDCFLLERILAQQPTGGEHTKFGADSCNLVFTA